MNSSSQVFFAAYNTGPSQSAPVVPVASRRNAPSAAAHSSTPNESVESLYARGACYRVDGASGKSAVPAPHTPPGRPATNVQKSTPNHSPAQASAPPTSRPDPKPLQLQPFDVGYFDLNMAAHNTSCLVVPPFLPDLPPTTVPQTELDETPSNALDEDGQESIGFEEIDEPVDSATADEPDHVPPTDESWAATWEVDEFCWPEDASLLYKANQEYFRFAGQKLLDASREGLKVLAIVATRGKEGCTTLAMCLAQGAAYVGGRVALIDGNLSNPELGVQLGLDFSRGWQDVHADEAPLAEAAVLSLADQITLFPLSATHRMTTLNDSKVSSILRNLTQHFDLVIIDAGTLPFGDGVLFEAGAKCPVQAAMVVRDVRRSTESETMVTGSSLKSLGIEAIGIAENFTPTEAALRSRAA